MKYKNLISDFLQAFFGAQKMVRLYPNNNPMYMKAIDNLFATAARTFEQTGDIVLQIESHALLSNNEEVYRSDDQYGNLAFLFFREGLRELTFKKEIAKEELEDFLNIVSRDDEEFVDGGLVILLWDKDFQGIRYVVDESFLSEDNDYGSKVVQQALKETTPQDKIMAAYRDALTAEEVKSFEVESPSESDLDDLRLQLDRDSELWLYKIINIIFELYYHAESGDELDDITSIMKSLVSYIVTKDEFENLIDILKKIGITMADERISGEIKASLEEVVYYAGSPEIVKALGSLLDKGDDIDEDTLDEFAAYLGNNAIESFIDLLGELQNYSSRQMVMNVLSKLGRKDIKILINGLLDQRWFLVRNIVIIIRKIGDKGVASQLIKAGKHPDMRVKTEVINTIGELKSSQAMFFLKQNLSADEQPVRISTVRALGHIYTDNAKRILIKHIKEDKAFVNKSYEEKRCFFEVLCSWKDDDVAEFIAENLNKRPYLNRKRNYENMACAAYALGRLGKKEYLPLLKKYEHSRDPLLKEHVKSAIRSLVKERG